jgi:hypothetical protein
MENRTPILAAMALTAALATSGCETFASQGCDTSVAGNPPLTYAGGTVQDGVYQTSPWTGELLRFPGGTVYDLAISPALAAPPRWISLWISFAEDGTADGGGVLARATANEAVILHASADHISVQNQGCQDFWLLVTAGTGPTQP